MSETMKPLWCKVGILRSELFAHTSIDLTSKAIFEKADITPDEIKKLIEMSKEYLNMISKPLNSSPDLSTSAIEDTKLLLENLIEFNEGDH